MGLSRLRRGPMAPHIDRFAAFLGERGYTRGRVRWAVRLAGGHSRYAESVGIDRASEIDGRLTEHALELLRRASTIAHARPDYDAATRAIMRQRLKELDVRA